MSKYVICFSKTGYIKYISHLDMLRLFKRAFKRAGIALQYSHGFNPHPIMSFAQPLSLGYTSTCEIVGFEMPGDFPPEDILNRMKSVLPEGIGLKSCRKFDRDIGSLASNVCSATYKVTFPAKRAERDFDALLKGYLAQDRIMAMKRRKKTNRMIEEDIKNKIRSLKVLPNEYLTLEMVLDSGSSSNLSPELVISTFVDFAGLPVKRHDIEVQRTNLGFSKNFRFYA